MTSAEFLALPPRERDARVAENVMVWHREHAECGLPPGEYGSDNIRGFPHYSTEISAAWEVVEKFNRIVITKLDMPERYLAEIVFYFGMGNFEEHKAEASTAPLAICLAALKAVGAITD